MSTSAPTPTPTPTAATDGAPAPKADLRSALVTGRALILLQLLSRLLTFALNQALVRLAPPSVFGTAAIQFDLVAATILFLSREGVRNALLRRENKKGYSAQDAALAAWPLRVGVVVAAAAVALYLGTSGTSTTSQPFFLPSLALYVLAALLELSIEPLYVRALSSSPPNITVRVRAEGGMAIARAVVSCACLVLGPPRTALLGFAVGHFAGAVWLAGRYIYEYGGVKAVPGLIIPPQAGYDAQTKDLALANSRQSVVKHVLTEADRIAVGQIADLGDQGGYAVAMNYGSLVARIVFQPLEETLLLHWSRALDSDSTLPLLTLALRLSLHLALLFPVFLPPLLPLVLPILLPRRYTAETSAAATLQTYLVAYLPVLSLNGILEAFHAASAQPAQVARQARFMIASSGAFAISLLLLTRLRPENAESKTESLHRWLGRAAPGVSGLLKLNFTTEQALIYASCIAMLVRIGYAFAHARAVAAARGQALPLSAILPRPLVRAVVAVTGGALWFLAGRTGPSLRDQAVLLGTGAAAGVSVLVAIYVAEKDEFRRIGSRTRKAD